MADELLTPQQMDEKAQKWVKDNAFSLILGISLGIGAILGFNYFKAQGEAQIETASDLYFSIEQSFSQSNIANITSNVEKLKKAHADTVYAPKAVLLYAKQLSVSDAPKAVSEYQWVIDNAKELGVREVAKMRQSKLFLAQGEVEKARQIAQSNKNASFSSYYQEILGDIAVKENKLQEARTFYQAALDTILPSQRVYKVVLELKLMSLPKSGSEPTQENS